MGTLVYVSESYKQSCRFIYEQVYEGTISVSVSVVLTWSVGIVVLPQMGSYVLEYGA